jgi:uncharacterized membrane protein YhaH (DUF805 family)
MLDFFLCYGRIGRLRFLLYIAITVGLVIGAGLLWMHFFPQPAASNLLHRTPNLEPHSLLSNLMMAAMTFGSFYLLLATLAKRLHDINASGAWALLIFPFFGIGVFILALLPGDKKKNRFGEAPGVASPSE